MRFEHSNTKEKRVTSIICTENSLNTDIMEAEKAIHDKYMSLGDDDGILGLATAFIGYQKQFEFGVIYYTKSFGVCVLSNQVNQRYLDEGGPYGALGWLCSDHEDDLAMMVHDNDNSCVSFAYDQEEMATIWQSTGRNAFLIKGKIRGKKWLSLGGINSSIGVPMSESRLLDSQIEYVEFGLNEIAIATISNIIV